MKWFSTSTKLIPTDFEISFATSLPKLSGALIPVPTAVPPIANLINENRDDETSYLLVTHYSRILRYLDVDRVHIVVKGNVVKSGSKELIEEVDSGGYTQYQEQ